MARALPVSAVRIMTPNGTEISVAGNAEEKRVVVTGLMFGTVTLDHAEPIALRDALNILFTML